MILALAAPLHSGGRALPLVVLFKTGICDVRGWDRNPATRLDRLDVSYRLLRCASQGRVDIFEGIVRNLRYGSGVSGTTYRKRLSDVDAVVNELLVRRFEALQSLLVHDWAASDCITSAEWARSIAAHFPAVRFVASDLHLHLLEIASGAESYVLDADGRLLQYIRPPFVVSLRGPMMRRPVNRLLALRALRRAAGFSGLLKSCQWSGLDDATIFHFPPWSVSRLPLVHPEAVAFRSGCEAFQIETHSVLESLREPADVIRTMNVLNSSYFTVADLNQSIRSVFCSLRSGGLWVAGRTIDDADLAGNRVTVMERRADRFAVVERMHGGWELERTALEWSGN